MNTPEIPLHEDLRNLVGTVISERYRVDELIGIGGMGAVFRGHHLGLKRDVAIKVLHPDLTRDPELSARFDREAHSASRLDHPNCMQVTDFGSTEAGMKFMVMQLLSGHELADDLGQPLAPLDAAERMLQILRGLEHAHEQGIVHRDLKPENVFVTQDHDGALILKLVDFGIAKIVAGDGSQDTMTQMGLIFGTPAYMSPEQATGMEIDARTDLYSAGVILYEMLAGRPPFEAEDPVALVRMQVSQDAPPLPETVPEPFRSYVARMMAKQRDQRFANAHEARLALEQLRNEQALAEGVPIPHTGALSMAHSVAPSAAIPSAPSAARPLAAGAAAMVGVGLLAWALLTGGEGRSSASEISQAPSPASYDPITEPVQEPKDELTADDLAAIDRLLLAGDKDGARKLLQPLIDRFPDDARLLWRQGKLLALSRSKRSQALASYGDAIERDPKLLQDKDFYAELMDLMKDPKLRDDALNLALRKMGTDGHQFLLELVNRKKKALDFANRHRALEELASDPENLARVDMKLNVALDLWQAHDSLTPCKSYAAALDAIEKEPDTYFLNALKKAPLPEPREGEGADPEDAAVCDTLEGRADALLAKIEQMEAAATGGDAGAGDEAEAGSKPKSTRRKRRSSDKKRSENCSLKQLVRGKCK